MRKSASQGQPVILTKDTRTTYPEEMLSLEFTETRIGQVEDRVVQSEASR